ncbi:unnamed protein product, partial [Oppiella nova]
FVAVSAAFDLSQKLVQHLKTENQLLRSATHDLMPPLVDQPLVTTAIGVDGCDNMTNGVRSLAICLDDNSMKTLSTDVPNEVTNDGNTGDNPPEKEICKSDLIAIQYEEEIKELREDWELLCLQSVLQVVVTHEDQINARSHLKESTDEDTDVEEDMDVDMNDKEKSAKSRLKCRICGRKFIDESLLEEHKRQHEAFDPKQVRCAEDLCGHQFD